ncbi:MAG: hypothetical protein RL538_415 [Candidatus Parcubacteria bacterium]
MLRSQLRECSMHSETKLFIALFSIASMILLGLGVNLTQELVRNINQGCYDVPLQYEKIALCTGTGVFFGLLARKIYRRKY